MDRENSGGHKNLIICSLPALVWCLASLFAIPAPAQTAQYRLWKTTATSTPTVDWDFTSLTSIPASLTFSRGSTASYYNSSGTITTAASGAARFDYDPVALTQ